MKITKVFKIEFDEPNPHWLCADNLAVALHSYCKNTQFSVKELMRFPDYVEHQDTEVDSHTLSGKDGRILHYENLLHKKGINLEAEMVAINEERKEFNCRCCGLSLAPHAKVCYACGSREIQAGHIDTNKISDGYHTFGELYEHRIQLFIALCKLKREYDNDCDRCTATNWGSVWRSKKHNDGSSYDGWFILGIDTRPGRQISYHLPMFKWDECDFAETLEAAPEWDGHSSNDVLERLKNKL
jgi:hypothetical protein